MQVCGVRGLLGVASPHRLSSNQDVPSSLASGVTASFLGTVIITLEMDTYPAPTAVLKSVLGRNSFLFIISFLSIKGIFAGEDVEIQEGAGKKTKVAQIPPLANNCC